MKNWHELSNMKGKNIDSLDWSGIPPKEKDRGALC